MTMNNPGSPYVFVIPVNFGVRDPEGNMLPGKLEYLGPHDEIQKIRNEQLEVFKRSLQKLTGYHVTLTSAGMVAIDVVLALEWCSSEDVPNSGFGHRASACPMCRQVNPNSPFAKAERFPPERIGHTTECLVRRIVEVACR